MGVLEWVAVVVAVVALVIVLALGGLFLRRRILQRQGAFDMCLRVGRNRWGGGWVFGIGRYRGDDVEWFRTFSYGGRPKWSSARSDLNVTDRRAPDPEEAYDLPAGHVVFVCATGAGSLEVSMSEGASMAFLAWLEAAPPGGHLVA
jgi:Protein of unknown function (DUF2550)